MNTVGKILDDSNETHRIPKGEIETSREGTYFVRYTEGRPKYFHTKKEAEEHLSRMHRHNEKVLNALGEIKKQIRFSKDEKHVYDKDGNDYPYFSLSDEDISRIAGDNKNVKDYLYRWRQSKNSSYIRGT